MVTRRNFLVSSAVGTAVCSAERSDAAVDPRRTSFASSGYDYQRPSIEKSRLLFIGDSITDMKWGRNEKDRNHYLGHSYVYLIASRLGVDMPHAKLAFFNRGVSGNRIADLKSRWQKDVIEMKPDLLSVLVGVNDRRVKDEDGVDFESWTADYRHVLTQSRDANPELKIVLINPFVLQTGWWMTKGGEWEVSRQQVDRMGEIVAALAQEFDGALVRMQKVFDSAAEAVGPEQWIWDGVHPLPQGHELIARHWIEAVYKKWG